MKRGRNVESELGVLFRHLQPMRADLHPEAPDDGEDGQRHEHRGDRPGEEDQPRPLGDEERRLERGLQHLGQDAGQNHGCDREAGLPHVVAEQFGRVANLYSLVYSPVNTQLPLVGPTMGVVAQAEVVGQRLNEQAEQQGSEGLEKYRAIATLSICI